MINKTTYKDLNAMEKSKFNQIDELLPIDVISRAKVIYSLLNKYLPEEKNKPNYEKAYFILMEYYDTIWDENKLEVDKRLKKVGL